jgi:hypothetical protein
MLLEEVLKRRFSRGSPINGFFITRRRVSEDGIQGKPVAEIRPFAFDGFFGLAFRAARNTVMTAIFA